MSPAQPTSRNSPIRKLESLGYHAALFALFYVYPFWYNCICPVLTQSGADGRERANGPCPQTMDKRLKLSCRVTHTNALTIKQLINVANLRHFRHMKHESVQLQEGGGRSPLPDQGLYPWTPLGHSPQTSASSRSPYGPTCPPISTPGSAPERSR